MRASSDSKPADAAIGEVNDLLVHWNDGDPAAQARLMSLLYPELKRIAKVKMLRERADHTLQPTALVNELYLHLLREHRSNWKSRAQFLAVAAQAMRRILIDYARAHKSEKRGGPTEKIELDENGLPVPDQCFAVLEIDDLLQQLAAQEPRMARIVELRYFGGLTNAEVAEVLGIHERTVIRDWQVARAWLYAHLQRGGGDDTRGMGTD